MRRGASYSPHTVHNYEGALVLVLGFAVCRGLIAGNPADRLTSAERPKPASSVRRFLSRSEIERLLAAVPDRYHACGLFSGLRLSELLGLRWGDIDFERHVLHVTHQLARDATRKQLKTHAARRDVILMPELAGALRRSGSPHSSHPSPTSCSAPKPVARSDTAT